MERVESKGMPLAMHNDTIVNLYRKMVLHGIIDDCRGLPTYNCLQLGCGVPYFGCFLKMLGFKVTAVNSPEGILIFLIIALF